MSIREITEQHRYPRWLMRFPRLIYIHYFLLRVFFLRSRICHKSLRTALKKLDPESSVLDIGCGEGQYLIPSAGRFQRLNFTGADIRTEHTRFLKILTRDKSIQNCQFINDNIEKYLRQNSNFHFIYMIGVLQYLSAPEKLIHNLFRHAPAGHRLMIYSPIQPAYHFWFYTRIKKWYSHYDAAQNTYHGIDRKQLLHWIESTDYRIIQHRWCYGKTATLGHEIMQSLIILFSHWPVWLKTVPLLIFIILSPIFVSLQIADPWIKPKRGNAVLIILEK